MAEGSDAETQATGVAIGDADTVAGPDTARASSRRVNPTRLGRFVIVRPLGRGGMSTVWEAEDPELGRRVAIKVLRGDRPSPAFTESLRREAQALAKLVHPNVVAVHDVGVDDGELFVVMQLVDGEPIDAWLRNRRATAAEVVAAFREAGKGLAAAHAAGLVHRDVKPGNILVDRDGAVRVGDFGLARNTGERAPSESGLAIAGTPSYMAPEQFDGLATPASDQYGFCVALYHMLARELPYADATIDDRCAAKTRTVPMLHRSHAPARVGRALARGMAVDPAARFPSMDALLVALAQPSRRWLAIGGPIAALAIGGAAVAFAMTGAANAPGARRPRGIPALGGFRSLTRYHTAVCAETPTIDGDEVVFDRTEGNATDLYAIPLAGGDERRLTTAAPWEWHANPGRRPGEVLHLIQDAGSAASIAYLDVATGREDIVANVRASDAVATMRGIVYATDGGKELHRVDAGGDMTLAVGSDGVMFGELAISHHADRIAAPVRTRDGNVVCLLDAVTAARDCFTGGPDLGRPAFGSDDRFLYYGAAAGIRRRELATGSDTVIAPDASAIGGMAISADGRALVYSDCGTRTQVFRWMPQPATVVSDDPAVRDITAGSGALVWVHAPSAAGHIVIHTEGQRDRQITDVGFGYASEPALSPDGRWLAFHSTHDHVGIYVVDLQAAAVIPAQVGPDPHDEQPHWLGDDELVFVRKDDRADQSTIFVVDRDGGTTRPLPFTSRIPVGGWRHHLLVASSTKLYWIDEDTGVETPGPALEGRDRPNGVTSPNGRWLVLRSGMEGQHMRRMSLDPPGPVEELPAIEAGKTFYGIAIDDDGQVFIALQTWVGNLYVLPAQPGAPY